MNTPGDVLVTTEEDLVAWEEAYTAVEAYLLALRLRNRLLVAELVRRILFRAAEKYARFPERRPQEWAIREALDVISEWTQSVLGQPLEHGRLAARGRLALLLANMPGRWQTVFLTPPPWPDDFIQQMRQSYLEAAPHFAELTMVARPLELNVIGSSAALWYETMGRSPILRSMFVWLFLATLAFTLWFFLL